MASVLGAATRPKAYSSRLYDAEVVCAENLYEYTQSEHFEKDIQCPEAFAVLMKCIYTNLIRDYHFPRISNEWQLIDIFSFVIEQAAKRDYNLAAFTCRFSDKSWDNSRWQMRIIDEFTIWFGTQKHYGFRDQPTQEEVDQALKDLVSILPKQSFAQSNDHSQNHLGSTIAASELIENLCRIVPDQFSDELLEELKSVISKHLEEILNYAYLCDKGDSSHTIFTHRVNGSSLLDLLGKDVSSNLKKRLNLSDLEFLEAFFMILARVRNEIFESLAKERDQSVEEFIHETVDLWRNLHPPVESDGKSIEEPLS